MNLIQLKFSSAALWRDRPLTLSLSRPSRDRGRVEVGDVPIHVLLHSLGALQQFLQIGGRNCRIEMFADLAAEVLSPLTFCLLPPVRITLRIVTPQAEPEV